MKKHNQTNYKLKKSVNRLFFQNSRYEPPSRKYLMHQIKNIILTNKQLNHRFMDFNFNKEYKQMHKTMTRFNSEQNDKKNLVSKLSKENQNFTKSYSNIIASLAIKLEKKNINFQTISNFNQKYKQTSTISKQNENFFYEDPLLLTKRKDLDNFYINENNINTHNDDSLKYSKKLLLGLDDNSPLNRVLKIIENHSNKMQQKEMNENNDNFKEATNKNNFNNISPEKKSLSDRNRKDFKKRNNLFYNQFTDINKKNEEDEIKQLKKYNKSIQKIINKNNPDRIYTQTNLKEYKLASLLDYFNYDKTQKNNNNKETNSNSKFNSISSKNVNSQFMLKIGNIKPIQNFSIKINNQKNDLIDNEIEKMVSRQNKMHKSIKKKLMKMKKLKGPIQIQNIYKDLVKTKETIHEYEKKKQPKFKYLYSIFNDTKFSPFQKEEKENSKIKKLDQILFRTVNQFHNI